MSRLLRKSPAIIVAVVLAGRLIAAEPVEWKVVSVHDGDTLTAVDARDEAGFRHHGPQHSDDVPEIRGRVVQVLRKKIDAQPARP